MKKIILIGWSPTTGKSTLAQNLSKYLNIPWVSTDQIRNIMRNTARREDYPNLFIPKWYEKADVFLKKFSAKEISDMEFEQSEATWQWIESFIKWDYTFKNWFIIEWVNIIPELVYNSFNWSQNIQTIFIWDNNKERVKKVIYERWLFDDAEKYSDEYKNKEVEWVNIFYERIKNEAQKYNFPFIDINKNDSDLKKVLIHIS